MTFYLDVFGLTFCFVFTFFVTPRRRTSEQHSAERSHRPRKSDTEFSLWECLHLLGLLLVNLYQVHVCIVKLVDQSGSKDESSTSSTTLKYQIRPDPLRTGAAAEKSGITPRVRSRQIRTPSVKKTMRDQGEVRKTNSIPKVQPEGSDQDDFKAAMWWTLQRKSRTIKEKTRITYISNYLQEQQKSASLQELERSTSLKEQPKSTSPKEQPNSISPKEQPNSTSPKEQANSTSPKEQPNSTSSKEQPNSNSPKELPISTSVKEEPKRISLKEQPKRISLKEPKSTSLKEQLKKQPKSTSMKEKPHSTSVKEQPLNTFHLNGTLSQDKINIAVRRDDINIYVLPSSYYGTKNGYLKWEPEHKKLDLHGKTQQEGVASFNRFFNRQLQYYKENGYRDEDKYIFVITGHCKNRPGKVARIKPEIQSILHGEHWSHFWFNNGGEVMIEFECEEYGDGVDEDFCDNYVCNCYDDDDYVYPSD